MPFILQFFLFLGIGIWMMRIASRRSGAFILLAPLACMPLVIFVSHPDLPFWWFWAEFFIGFLLAIICLAFRFHAWDTRPEDADEAPGFGHYWATEKATKTRIWVIVFGWYLLGYMVVAPTILQDFEDSVSNNVTVTGDSCSRDDGHLLTDLHDGIVKRINRRERVIREHPHVTQKVRVTRQENLEHAYRRLKTFDDSMMMLDKRRDDADLNPCTPPIIDYGFDATPIANTLKVRFHLNTPLSDFRKACIIYHDEFDDECHPIHRRDFVHTYISPKDGFVEVNYIDWYGRNTENYDGGDNPRQLIHIPSNR